jgi:hypothetical protein
MARLEDLSSEAFSKALSLEPHGTGGKNSNEVTPFEEGDAPSRSRVKATAVAWMPWHAGSIPNTNPPQKEIHTDFYVRPGPILQIFDYKSDHKASRLCSSSQAEAELRAIEQNFSAGAPDKHQEYGIHAARLLYTTAGVSGLSQPATTSGGGAMLSRHSDEKYRLGKKLFTSKHQAFQTGAIAGDCFAFPDASRRHVITLPLAAPR